MPRQINNKIITNKKTMKREYVFPLIIGLVLGALVMIFWQFSARLNNASMVLAQLEQATAQNTKTINDVIAFINQATGANKAATPAAGTQTPVTE
jgi:hypothetical protein